MDRQRVVWVIVGERWTRALLRAELIERGFDAVGFVAASDALEQLAARPPDAIVVDVTGEFVPHLEKIVRIGVPVIATGGRPSIDGGDVRRLPFSLVLSRPVTLGEIADRVAALLGHR